MGIKRRGNLHESQMDTKDNILESHIRADIPNGALRQLYSLFQGARRFDKSER
jgi:hypothetical protein